MLAEKKGSFGLASLMDLPNKKMSKKKPFKQALDFNKFKTSLHVTSKVYFVWGRYKLIYPCNFKNAKTHRFTPNIHTDYIMVHTHPPPPYMLEIFWTSTSGFGFLEIGFHCDRCLSTICDNFFINSLNSISGSGTFSNSLAPNNMEQ